MKCKIFLKQYIKMFAQNCVLPVWYQICRYKRVIPGLIIFADAHHDQRPENVKFLYRRLSEYAEEKTGKMQIKELYLNYQTASPAKVTRHMLEFMKLYARAECVIVCDNFLPAASCRKRKETRVVQLWHACGALKKFGYDTTDDIPKQYHGNVFRNIDLVTVSSPKCVSPFASAMRLNPECVKPLGVSRTDVFFQEGWKENCRREFYRFYPEANGKKIVLWAPTFRGNPGSPRTIELDLNKLQEQLGEEWLVLSRVHPHMHEHYLQSDCKIPTERLFPVVDVMIADYSSLIFEYLLFDKPLVLYVPDLTEYQERRGFYLEFSEIPGVQVKNESMLPSVIEQEYLAYCQQKKYNKVQSDENQMRQKKREQFIQTYMQNCDGHATDRILEYIIKEM